MKTPSFLFIASDFVTDPALDATAETLRAQGHHVIRGSRAIPGQRTAFSLPANASSSLDQLDVIVMTSRVTLDPPLSAIHMPSHREKQD